MTVRCFRVEKYIEFSVVVNCFIGSLLKNTLFLLTYFFNTQVVMNIDSYVSSNSVYTDEYSKQVFCG
jgi:hypothetical protein